MFENIIKGGIKPGMVLETEHPIALDKYDKWIVFPDRNNKLCAVNYGKTEWTRLKQEANKLYIGRMQCIRIYEPPTGWLTTNETFIWSEVGGVIKPEYKPASSLDDSLGDLLANLGDKSSPIEDDKNSEETSTQYFY